MLAPWPRVLSLQLWVQTPIACPHLGRTECGAGRLSQAQSHLLNYRPELIVILTLTSLVITEKDSAPLNDELCV